MNRRKALLALLLLVPAPSLGALCGMTWFPNSLAGVVLFAASKVWLFGLPVVWLKLVDKSNLSLSPVRHGGLGMGLLTGLLIDAVIVVGFIALGPALIDRAFLVQKMSDIGLAAGLTYTGLALYWIAVNSVLEEYVWRWFVYEKCEALLKPAVAIPCAALFFTLHHVFALRVYLGPAAVFFCSAGVFIGGALWSLLYRKYRSIWPGYLSHALVDLCIFVIGALLIFGR